MRTNERFQHHYNEMIEWAEGRKSHWNAVIEGCRDTDRMADATTLCAMADAAEVARHAAVLMALRSTEGERA